MDLQCYKAFTISEDLQIMNQKKKLDFLKLLRKSEGLGFSERGLGKAYHAGRN